MDVQEGGSGLVLIKRRSDGKIYSEQEVNELNEVPGKDEELVRVEKESMIRLQHLWPIRDCVMSARQGFNKGGLGRHPGLELRVETWAQKRPALPADGRLHLGWRES